VKLCDTVIADAFSFGIVAGMAFKLFTKPNNTRNNVKLIITKQNEPNVLYDVWLDSVDATVGEVLTHSLALFRPSVLTYLFRFVIKSLKNLIYFPQQKYQ